MGCEECRWAWRKYYALKKINDEIAKLERERELRRMEDSAREEGTNTR